MKKISYFILLAILFSGSIWAQNAKPVTVKTMPPVVVKTIPQAGDTNVDPALKEIRVTFSKTMLTNQQWSVVDVSNTTTPKISGAVHFLSDKKTFVIPVTLQPGRTYAVWLNYKNFNYFKDEDQNSSVPYLLVFQTR